MVATLVAAGVAGGCDALGLGKDTEVVSSLVIRTGCCSLPYGEEQLAGIEIEVSGGGQTRSFTAEDFVDPRDVGWATPPVQVPESGRAFVAITLRQDGAIVSEGSGSWTLEPGSWWSLDVERDYFPRGAGVSPKDRHRPRPRCGWVTCRAVWRFEILEEVRNRPDEALWLSLFRDIPGANTSDVTFTFTTTSMRTILAASPRRVGRASQPRSHPTGMRKMSDPRGFRM